MPSALDRITLVGLDGGADTGCGLAMEMPERFSRLVIMNTDLPTGDRPLNPMFSVFKQFVEIEPDVTVGHIIRSALALRQQALRRGDRRVRGALSRRVLQGWRRGMGAALSRPAR